VASIDPRIAMGYQGAQIENPMNALARVMQLRGMEQQNALARAQFEDLTQERALKRQQMENALATQARRDAFLRDQAGGFGPPQRFSAANALMAGLSKEQIETLAQGDTLGMPEVARTIERVGSNGMPETVQFDKFGRPVGNPLAKPVESKFIDLGGRQQVYNPFAVLPGQSFDKTMTPDGRDASARGWATLTETKRHNSAAEGIQRENVTTVRAEKEAAKKAEQVDKAVTKFSDTVQKEGIPELETAIAQAEGAIKKYEEGAVPGVGPLKNALPAAVMTQEGKDVRQALAQVRNIVLSARSGAAVTDQELRRLVEEIGTGVGMTEADMRSGLAKVRARIDTIKQNAAAGVSDDVLKTYADRGGLDLRRGPQVPAAGQPEKVTNDAEYNALPSGTLYVAPDGQTRRKK
jgi:hypothetical protein